jgi:hypothetical protein
VPSLPDSIQSIATNPKDNQPKSKSHNKYFLIPFLLRHLQFPELWVRTCFNVT